MPTTNTLTWNPNPPADGVVKYSIYRKIGSAPARVAGDLFASVPATQLTFVDSVTVDGDYFYALTATDLANNESALGAPKDKVVDATPPSPPTGLVVV